MNTHKGLGIPNRAPGDWRANERDRRRRRLTRRSPVVQVTLMTSAEPAFPRQEFPVNPLLNLSDASLEGIVGRLRKKGAAAPLPRQRSAPPRVLDPAPAAALLPALQEALALSMTVQPARRPVPRLPTAPLAASYWPVVFAAALLLLALAATVVSVT